MKHIWIMKHIELCENVIFNIYEYNFKGVTIDKLNELINEWHNILIYEHRYLRYLHNTFLYIMNWGYPVTYDPIADMEKYANEDYEQDKEKLQINSTDLHFY
jgi:hypothetical protein